MASRLPIRTELHDQSPCRSAFKRIRRPVCQCRRSHNCTVSIAQLSVARRCPSGLNTTPSTASAWPQRFADRLAGTGIPQPHHVVPTRRCEPAPVRTEHHISHHRRSWPQRFTDRLAGGGDSTTAPYCPTRRCEPAPIRTELHISHQSVWPSGLPIGWPVRDPTTAPCRRHRPRRGGSRPD